jgi:F-type H+-transporting ATPase subunit delta
MKAKDKIRQTANTLLQMSLEEDEVSAERVNAILAGLEAHPPRNYRLVLREYLRLVSRHLSRNQARVEYAGALAPELINSIEASLSAHYGRPITAVPEENKALIAGWRIRIGSDVYDSSIQNHLNQMAKAALR